MNASESPSPAKVPPSRRWNKLKRLIVVMLVFGCLGYAMHYLIKMEEQTEEEVYTGYVTSYNLYQSASVSGTLDQLCVQRGQYVEPGDLLFRLNDVTTKAHVQKIEKHIRELAALKTQDEAIVERSRANLNITQLEIERTKLDYDRYTSIQRKDSGAVSQQTVDNARIAYENALKIYTAQEQDVASNKAKLASTQEQIHQAAEDLIAAKRQLDELSGYSPAKARVENTMYQEGEWATMNTPIVSLVPLNQIKVRFFVPQREVHRFETGTKVRVTYDGIPQPLTATVDYTSTRPEYTPPVIYSLQTRDKLVFLVEAVPEEHAESLIIGQPLDVRPIESRKEHKQSPPHQP